MDPMEKKKFVCIYILKGMLRTSVGGDTLKDVYNLLEMKEIVSGPVDGMSDVEILKKIYADSAKTTGRLTVYQFDPEYDPETSDEFDDEYVPIKDSLLY